jgi:hypothetical protein
MPLRRRGIYLSIALICFLACWLIATHGAGLRFVRGFLGDCLVVVLMYFLAKTLQEFRPLLLAIGMFLVACGVEWLQYLNLADHLHLAPGSWQRIVLGASFDPRDFLAYFLGALMAFLLDSRLGGLVRKP